jgi:hypothetical protein
MQMLIESQDLPGLVQAHPKKAELINYIYAN